MNENNLDTDIPCGESFILGPSLEFSVIFSTFWLVGSSTLTIISPKPLVALSNTDSWSGTMLNSRNTLSFGVSVRGTSEKSMLNSGKLLDSSTTSLVPS